MGVPQGGGRADAGHPVFLDDVLVDRWFAELDRSARPIPQSLRDRWHRALLDAVREAREPRPASVAGRFAALDRYFTGVAAGIAAGLGTLPVSDGGDSDPVILAAGLLAGSAALQAAEGDRVEASVAGAAAAAVVDVAASGHGLADLIAEAGRSARQLRAHTLVGVALDALGRAVTPVGRPAGGTVYFVSLVLEPVTAADELDPFELDNVINALAFGCDWVPTRTGFRLYLQTDQPGPLLEALFSFGRVSELNIDAPSTDAADRDPA